MNDPFAFLPDELILQIALLEPIHSINQICRSNRRFNNLICNSNYFWREKFIRDLGEPKENLNILSWRLAYQNSNALVGFGNNRYEKLGLIEEKNIFVPTLIPISQNIKVKAVSCGEDNTMMIDIYNNVWGFGSDFTDIENIPNIKAKAISCSTYTMIIDINDNVWFSNQPEFKLIQLAGIKAKAISCGSEHMMILDLNDDIWTFGNNEYGQLGLGDNQNRLIPTQIPNIQAKAISCGTGYSMIIDLNNNVWSFGYNRSGELGLGDGSNRRVPTQIRNIKAKDISCGGSHSIIIDLNDNVFAFGFNKFGQLGLGDTIDRFVPTKIVIKAKSVSCGFDYTMIIDLNDNVWSFGNNRYGQLGLGDKDNKLTPTQIVIWQQPNNEGNGIPVPRNIKAKAISCGHNHTMIILDLSPQFEPNVHLISFAEATQRLDNGDFLKFDFLPQYQVIPHKPENYIVTYYGKDNNIYLVEVGYDWTTKKILRPL